MKFCKKCGKQNIYSANFCRFCNTPFSLWWIRVTVPVSSVSVSLTDFSWLASINPKKALLPVLFVLVVFFAMLQPSEISTTTPTSKSVQTIDSKFPEPLLAPVTPAEPVVTDSVPSKIEKFLANNDSKLLQKESAQAGNSAVYYVSRFPVNPRFNHDWPILGAFLKEFAVVVDSSSFIVVSSEDEAKIEVAYDFTTREITKANLTYLNDDESASNSQEEERETTKGVETVSTNDLSGDEGDESEYSNADGQLSPGESIALSLQKKIAESGKPCPPVFYYDEKSVEGGREVHIIRAGESFDDHFNTWMWYRVDTVTGEVYEYDIADDKMVSTGMKIQLPVFEESAENSEQIFADAGNGTGSHKLLLKSMVEEIYTLVFENNKQEKVTGYEDISQYLSPEYFSLLNSMSEAGELDYDLLTNSQDSAAFTSFSVGEPDILGDTATVTVILIGEIKEDEGTRDTSNEVTIALIRQNGIWRIREFE